MKTLRAYTVAALLAALLAASPVAAQSAPSAPSAIEAARTLGDLSRLRELATASDDAEALALRAELALLDADIEGAARFARTAAERATTDRDRELAAVLLARAQSDGGDQEAAEDTLRAHLSAHPLAHRARLELGKLLVARGADAEAEVVLATFSTLFNNRVLKSSADLTLVSEAMATIGSFDDANYAMERAIEADPKNLAGLVHWGNLLLQKYNTADAETTFDEVLAVNPEHVDALVGKARTELQLSNDYSKIRGFLERAERLAPRHVGMLLTRAEIAVYDTDCPSARQFARAVLERRPEHLEALTFIAACDYLDDNKVAWEKSKKKVLAINPTYADVLSETSRYAVRVHRYEEAAALDRAALQLRPDHGPALLGLGTGLSRIGKEDEALEMFRRAFEVDPYNVRAYNMVELYETQMKDYVFTDHGRFLIRAHRSENEIVNALVAPVVSEALGEFDGKYRFAPARDHLAVEVFPNPTTFAVRSVGLPNISPHGICFGKVVVSRSPSEGNFNWRQVIWHELAHVYHIQLSNSRVPRWFTEGLAEYETNVKDPGWQRYHDRELASALNAGTLRGVMDLSKGFTHATSFEEILRAYHQSSLVIHFIAQTWGYEKLPEMLRGWGAFDRTPEVLQKVLGVTPAEFDERFEAWLGRRYLTFKRQLTVDLASLPTAAELQRAVEGAPQDGRKWAELAVARYREQQVAQADAAMTQATTYGSEDAEVQAIAAMYWYERGRVKDAYQHGLAVLDAGRDSYDVRILLGGAAVKLEDAAAAEVHYRAAATLWPDGKDAWEGVLRSARALDDAKLIDRAEARIFMLDQNDPRTARQRTETLQKAGDVEGVARAARRWIDINPLDSRAHEALIDAATQLGRPALAVDAWSALAVLRPSDAEVILLPAIRTLRSAKAEREAERLAQQARAADVPEAKIADALK